MPRVPSGRLAADARTEVLVVGAGISGALTAEALSHDHKVMIVDRRGPVLGSTPASTALVEYEIDTPMVKLRHQIGTEATARAWQRSRLAVASLAVRTRALGIACDLVSRDSLYLAGDMLDAGELEEERSLRLTAGIETGFLTRGSLRERFGIRRQAALLAYDDLALDPRRLTSGYLRAAIANGASLHTPVEVTDVETTQGGHLVATRAGPTIRCEILIFATGYEFPDFVPARGHKVNSTYAIATLPQPRRLWPEECLIWEASDPYLYLRTTPDGRIICGGEDEEFSDEEKRDRLIPQKTAALERKLKRLFPEVDPRAAFAWAGAFGSTGTGLPSIGEVPGRKNCWAILGFGGNGITYSRIAADILRAALAGRRDPDADLYAFTRRENTAD